MTSLLESRDISLDLWLHKYLMIDVNAMGKGKHTHMHKHKHTRTHAATHAQDWAIIQLDFQT